MWPFLGKVSLTFYRTATEKRGLRHNNGRASHIFIFVYNTRAHHASGEGQWIGMMRRVGDDAKVETEVRKHLIAGLAAKPTARFGLTEKQRKAVFQELFRADDRATREAEKRYRKPIKRAEYQRDQSEKYKAEIAKKYKLTTDQLLKITVEGMGKNWPAPPLD
jgi:hypothetical protein